MEEYEQILDPRTSVAKVGDHVYISIDDLISSLLSDGKLHKRNLLNELASLKQNAKEILWSKERYSAA